MDAIVVIGTSAGGFEALRTIVSGLPSDFAMPVCIVQHLGRHASELAERLSGASSLPVAWAIDGARLRVGTIYVAPPDRHLLVSRDALELTRGPRENFARPGIDPLFRSAAAAFGEHAIGIVLTGRLGDGTAGMYEIKRRGGTTIVQDPLEAEYAEMPRNVLAHVEVDYRVQLAEIPSLLTQLVADAGVRDETVQENAMAAQAALGEVTAFVCPECGGAMKHERLGTLGLYVCHIGHKLSTESLVYAQRSRLEYSAETLVRELHEHAAICRQIASEAADGEHARRWNAASQEADQRLEIVRATFDGPWQM